MAKARYAACMACRSEAQKAAGITDRQHASLRLGRPKGTNHRAGYRHKEESRRKASESHKRFCAEHPDRVAARGAKTRADRHYKWRGGASKLNLSIRQMTENRKWMDAVKERDGGCIRCGARENLESHHKKTLAELVAELGIRSRDDARRHADVLWSLSNGETLCVPCHDKEHGRAPRAYR